MDPLAQYATESDVHGRGQGPQPASRKQVRDDDEPARWWQDMHLVATTGVAQLDVGPTAYRLIGEKGRVVVLLHGAFSFSYIFLDLVTRLSAEDASSPLAGQAAKRFLLFDFLGRGRTPWPSSNPPCTCELLRTQLEQLLSYLNLGSDKVVLIGHDMGSLVGANFAAKNPERVFGFIALGPAGTRRHRQIEELVASGSAGNLFWHDNDEHLSSLLDRLHRADFYDQDVTSRHGSLINLHCAMIRWQIENTEGYLPAVKSTLRFFPLCEHTRREAPGAISDALESILGKPQPTSGLSILREVALGAHRTVVVWGSKDTLYPPELGEDGLKGALPGADIVYMSCGHALLLENYRETAREVKIRLLTFWSEDESGMNPSTGSIDTRNELAAVAAKECDRVQVAEALVACLQPPHYFATVLSALSQAQRLGMQGALVEEVARIVLYQSRARLLQQSIQICIDHDDIPTLVEVIHNGRLYFLKGVEGYAPCHCRCCSQWAVDLDSMDAYIASRQKVRTLQEVCVHTHLGVASLGLTQLILVARRSSELYHAVTARAADGMNSLLTVRFVYFSEANSLVGTGSERDAG